MLVGKDTKGFIISENIYENDYDQTLFVISDSKLKNKEIVVPNITSNQRTILFDGDRTYMNKCLKNIDIIDFNNDIIGYDPFSEVEGRNDAVFLTNFLLRSFTINTTMELKLFVSVAPLYLSSILIILSVYFPDKLNFNGVYEAIKQSLAYNSCISEFDSMLIRAIKKDSTVDSINEYLKFKAYPDKIKYEVIKQWMKIFEKLKLLPYFNKKNKNIIIKDILSSKNNTIIVPHENDDTFSFKICDILIFQLMSKISKNQYMNTVMGKEKFVKEMVSIFPSCIEDINYLPSEKIAMLYTSFDKYKHHTFFSKMLSSKSDLLLPILFIGSKENLLKNSNENMVKLFDSSNDLIYLNTSDNNMKKSLSQKTLYKTIDDFDNLNNEIYLLNKSDLKSKSGKRMYEMIIDKPFFANLEVEEIKEIKSLMQDISGNLKITPKKNK